MWRLSWRPCNPLTRLCHDRGHDSGHRRRDVARIPYFGFRPDLPSRRRLPIEYRDTARLTIQLEKHAAFAIGIRLARREVTDDKALAYFNFDFDFIPGFHAVEEHRRRQLTHVAVLTAVPGIVTENLRIQRV